MAHCRVCKEVIDKSADDWIMPKRNYYYHKTCYKNWKEAEHVNDDDYIELIYDYISRDLKVKYDWYICEAQRKKFIKENNMTNKGILFALKYFYDIKHGDWSKGHGGIGIIPFIYTDSCSYWAAQERKSAGIIKQIEMQMRESANRHKTIIKKQDSKIVGKHYDFSMLDELGEDDE